MLIRDEEEICPSKEFKNFGKEKLFLEWTLLKSSVAWIQPGSGERNSTALLPIGSNHKRAKVISEGCSEQR